MMRKPTRRPLVDEGLIEEALMVALESSATFVVFFEKSGEECKAIVLGDVLALEYNSSGEEASFFHYGYLVVAHNDVLERLPVDRIIYFVREGNLSLAVHFDSEFQEHLLSVCRIRFYRYYQVLDSLESVSYLL